MTLLNNEQKVRLHKLYNEKRFAELELEIEMISDFKTRSAFLSNLLGVAKLRRKDQKDWLGAKELFLDSHKKDPDYIDALCNYSHVSVKLRDYDDAFKRLIENKKKGYNPKINEALARIHFFEGEIDKELELFMENEKNNDLNVRTASHFLTSLNYSSKYTQESYLEYCKKIDDKFSIPKENLKKLNNLKIGKDLRVGFVSPDLKEHSVYYFLKGTIDELRKNSIKVYLFNLRDPIELDDITENIKKSCDGWVDLHHKNDIDAANLIRENQINILIDIVGHFARNRFSIFKYKPSPIQVSWMGFVNTSGVKEIDYLIADPVLIKKDEEKLYSEKVLRLNNIWNCHKGFDEDVEVSPPPFLKNGYLTFGCFNNSVKISQSCINTWSQILKKIKNSKLLIKASSKDAEIAQKRIAEKFVNNNVDPNQLIFEKTKTKREDHLKMYHNIDISLDTFPYPGVTTSFESIWMGVPVMTLRGNNFVSRCGESINTNLGLNSFIGDDENDYVKKILSINEKKEDLKKLRMVLRNKSKNSPLFDKNSFGSEFSSLMRKIWEDHLDQIK